MTIDSKIKEKISEASRITSDPDRAERNLVRFFEQNPGRSSISSFSIAAGLFGVSQFLANYTASHPDELESAIGEIKKSITKELLKERSQNELVFNEQMDIADMMRALRFFKKRYLLRITIRDITGETDTQSSMYELTVLSEIILEYALLWSLKHNQKRFGEAEKSTIALIAFGKLGGEELNYSSDVDLMAVYENDEGQTSGSPGPTGVISNRISNHEFYCKVMEVFNKMLSSQTEDGIAYRVDLRLRPQGQKGDIVLPIKAYRTYYESWGRTWERMMLIRARPVAGDEDLGKAFIETIRPFVWREALDFAEIEEIKGLKKKIDSTFSRDDIKRGYGGIREAEFFIQTFQLLFGGLHKSLRSYRILNTIQALKSMKQVPEEDLMILWDNYLYLRRVEHYLQMKEDLQTHTLPASDEELEVLSKNMGAPSRDEFLANLRVKRMQIKSMYNSLLGSQEDVNNEAMSLLEGGLKDKELTEYLSFRKVVYPERCIVSLKKIRDNMRVFHTAQERSISREVIPQLLENALNAENPDRAIAGIESLLTTYGIKTAHLTAFKEQKELLLGVVKIFSMSPYLTRIFLSNQYYLNILIEEWSIFKSLSVMEGKLGRTIQKREEFFSGLAKFRRLEEVRFGMLFLLKILTVEDLFRGLSYLAEAIIKSVVEHFSSDNLTVIALGKLGGREMTFGSDLDIVFVSGSSEGRTAGEKVMKALTAYTDMGQLYEVDTRLRPEGSKGLLVQDLEGYRNYYLKHAQNWEIQALLKARPVGGDEDLAKEFMEMVKDVILIRGSEMKKDDITAMRERIIKELTDESGGIDVKLGPGGIGEIEFYIQYLQLHNAGRYPEILVQNTTAAMHRLEKKNMLTASGSKMLSDAYGYYRKIETLLRLNEDRIISLDSDMTTMSSKFMSYTDNEEFLKEIKEFRKRVLNIINEQ